MIGLQIVLEVVLSNPLLVAPPDPRGGARTRTGAPPKPPPMIRVLEVVAVEVEVVVVVVVVMEVVEVVEMVAAPRLATRAGCDPSPSLSPSSNRLL